MANNYNVYANETFVDKEKRVDGFGLQNLHDKFRQTNNASPQNRSFKRQVNSQTQIDSENEESTTYMDSEENPFTTVKNKHQENQKRTFQRGDKQFDSHVDHTDESFNSNKERKTNNHRIYTRRTNTNENVDDSSNMHHHNQNNKMNICTYPVNNQALSYATDIHLTPVRIKCNPALADKNTSLKFVQEFFKKIEHSFRNKYIDHKKALGFDYWWIDINGDLVGVIKDLSLYIYLCDVRHYPQQIDSVHLTPILPTHLPPQHAIVIKFAPNDISFLDIEEDLKKRYASIYHIEEMNGTRRMHSRHIRMDIYDKIEYNNILNSGTITLGGMLCEVDEYLPAPKILICTKCNSPGHTKKVCRLGYEKCRRCGEDRVNGDHKQCTILCHHCGGDHQANDYKCPILLKFRRDLVNQLRGNPNRLPPHMQMFIPLDCRIQKSERILSNQNGNDNNKPVQHFTNSNSLHDWPAVGKSPNTCSCEMHLKNSQADLDSFKLKYQLEIEKINNKLQYHSANIQKACLMMHTQISTQKEIIDSTSSIVKDLTFNMNMKVINIIDNFVQLLNELTPDDKTKNKLSLWQGELKTHHQYLYERQTAFNNHMQNLEKLWLTQTSNTVELIDLCLSIPHNDQ